MAKKKKKKKLSFVWKDRKHTFLGLPFSFTRYRLTKTKLIIDTGFFNRVEDDILLYRISDITLKRTFGERLLGLGTIHCCSADKTSPEFDIKRIRHPHDVKEQLSDLIEAERASHSVSIREVVDGDMEHGGGCDCDKDGDGVCDCGDHHH